MTSTPKDDANAMNKASEGLAAQPSSMRAPLKRGNSNRKETMNGPLYMQSSNNAVLVRRVKRKGESFTKQCERWFIENQIGLSFNLLALLCLVHWSMPRARTHTRKFYSLSYYDATTGKYGVGWDDAYFTFFSIILFTGLRAATMEYVLAPIGKWQGIAKRRVVTRFSEQAWLVIYYSIFWTLGLYIYYTSPYWLNLREMWTGWPDRQVDGVVKGYMLFQLAFWLQQILVINIEERRKDHWQMLTHHIITIILITSSYRYHHTRVGTVILVLMDIGDLVFGIAKCLKYTGHSTLCDCAFGVFMFAWFFCRHICFNVVVYSVWAHTPEIMTRGCYRGSAANLTGPLPIPSDGGFRYLVEPFVDPAGLVCYDAAVKWAFLAALLPLQAIMLAWFLMIIRVAIRVIRGEGADDGRSDEEDDGLDEEDDEEDEDASRRAARDGADFVYEEEVGVGEIDLKAWERRAAAKRQSTTATPAASGVSLPGHSDRKELLGRIGCEKQVE